LFGKLDSSKGINTKGIGLGLNICRKIVEACGGEIYLDPKYQLGASFCFDIQCEEPENSVIEIHLREDEGAPKSDMHHEISSHSLGIEDQSRSYTLPYTKLYSVVNKPFENPDQCECSKANKIMVVDDNIFNIVTMETMLEFQLNMKADRATNGREAVKKVIERN
jgi:hypothetical protein